MELRWTGRLSDGRFGISANPGDYDGVPAISTLLFDREPLAIHDDVLSVASVIAFGEYCSGAISLPRKTSPEVVKAIEEFLAPIWISASPVEFESRANPQGEGVLMLDNELGSFGSFKPEWGRPRNSTICLLPASEFGGAIASSEGIVLASNAATMGAFSSPEKSVRPEIAVALLFAETFRAGTIRLSSNYTIGEDEFGRLYDLLFSCKVTLERA